MKKAVIKEKKDEKPKMPITATSQARRYDDMNFNNPVLTATSSFADVKKSEEALYIEVQKLQMLLQEKSAAEERLQAEFTQFKQDAEVTGVLLLRVVVVSYLPMR